MHGFRGKKPQAEQLLRAGLYLSFGFHFHAESLTATPSHRLFLESDESLEEIAHLYHRAALLRATNEESLARQIEENRFRCRLSKRP